MRHLKKLVGNELLHLALVLSLLRVDPDVLLFPHFGLNTDYLSGSSGDNHGDVWTENVYNSLGGGLDGSLDPTPRLHPKAMESVLDRFQDEILEDLNRLGSYNRIRSFEGRPVEISAYILNTEPPESGLGSSVLRQR